MAKLKKKQAATSRKSTAAALNHSVSAPAANLMMSNFYDNGNGGGNHQMASLVSALAAANPNIYLNPLLMNNPLIAAALLQQQQIAAAAAANTAASVAASSRTKSRSVSNEGAAAVSSTPISPAVSCPPPPASTGLKLVLKRQSGDKYEVKPSSSADSVVTSSSGRPKREAARRVKFVFNEYETDSDFSSPDKKRNKLNWSASMPAAVSPFAAAVVNPAFFNTAAAAPFRSFSSSLDSNSSQLLFQKPPRSRGRKADVAPPTLTTVNQNTAVDDEDDESEEDDEEDEEDYEPPVIPFHPSEIIRRNFSEKVKIVLHQPKVHLKTSRPFQIVLVESKSNIICTKALLYIHLFQSYTAQCITCLTCGDYLTIGEFSKHLHQGEDDDDEDFAERLKQTFKVLPYRGKDKLELNEDDLETWKLFGIRYAKFKQEHLARLKQQKEDEVQKQKLRSASLSKDEEERPGQFKNWDQVSEDRTFFMIDKSKLIYNEVVCSTHLSSSSRSSSKPAKSDRLSDHEDSDSDDTTDSGMDTDENETLTAVGAEMTPTRVATARTSMVDDLSLSEDESESKPLAPLVGDTSLKGGNIARTDTIETEILSTVDPSDQAIESLRLKAAAEATGVSQQRRLPSKHEKYVNFYDNMSQANLMYICDNEFTIIPDSYVDYINTKRQSNQRKIKLAETSHFQKIWLSMCLDLELECRRVPSTTSTSTSAGNSNRSVILSSNDSSTTTAAGDDSTVSSKSAPPPPLDNQAAD